MTSKRGGISNPHWPQEKKAKRGIRPIGRVSACLCQEFGSGHPFLRIYERDSSGKPVSYTDYRIDHMDLSIIINDASAVFNGASVDYHPRLLGTDSAKRKRGLTPLGIGKPSGRKRQIGIGFTSHKTGKKKCCHGVSLRKSCPKCRLRRETS